MFPDWSWTMIAVAASFHVVGILSTLFRFWYRWHTGHMWWDDAWAALAFLADIACLVTTLLEQPIPNDSIPRFFTIGNWIVSFAYPTVMWAARISILAAMVRVSHPEGMLRHISIGTGVLFGIMATGMLGQRLQLCLSRACLLTRTVLTSQTTTDCVADVLLTALPVWSLRRVNLRRQRKILISATFSASMVINVVTVIQAVVCFQSLTSGSIIFEHVKVACTMIVCNLLIIVSFVYRMLHKGKTSLEDSAPDWNEHELTTVDLAQIELSQETSKARSLTAPSRATKSSTWSFRGDSRSKTYGSVAALGSQIFVEREEEYQ